MASKHSAESLREFSKRVLMANGLAEKHASVTAEVLVEADLLGHRTHGVDLLPIYVGFLRDGTMTRAGGPEAIADRGSTLLLDGRQLPGQSLIREAMDIALQRVADHGVVTVAIRRSQHTGCHAAYLAQPVEEGYFVLLTAASSFGRRIAPFGGLDPVFSPSPFAVGIPSAEGPVLVDMTMASTANSVCRQHYQRRESLPHEWLLDSTGASTADPAVLYKEPRGTILPLGGFDNGHKGFGLILMVEALALALTGQGHVFEEGESSQSVYLQVIDPQAFAGRASFTSAMGSIVEACRASRPAPGVSGPRLPGETALQSKRRQLETGVEIASDVRARIAEIGNESGVSFPEPLPQDRSVTPGVPRNRA